MASLLDPDARRVVRARDEDHGRVRGEIAASVPSSGNVKSARGDTSTARPPTASTLIAYMSNAGRITMLSASPSAGRRFCADHGGQQDPFVEAVGEQQRRLGHAEVLRGLAIHGVVVRIERDVVAAERAKRLEHLRRAPGGVLVQVQPQRAGGGDWVLICLAHTPLTIIDCACAVSPSASARVRTVGPSVFSPAAVTRWTETTRARSLPRAGRRAGARRRQWAARGWTRWRSRRPPARCAGR